MLQSSEGRASVHAPWAGALVRVLADNVEPCVFVQDRDGRLAFVNRALCRWLGRAEADLLGKGPGEVWPPALARKDRADLALVFTGAHLEHEERRPHGGRMCAVQALKVPLRDDQGTVCAALTLFHEQGGGPGPPSSQPSPLTVVGQLASGIVHDINNALMLLGSNLELLRRALRPENELGAHDLLRAMRQGLDHTASLTGQVLAFVRQEGRPLQPIDLNAVVSAVVGPLGPVFGPKTRVEARLSPGLVPVLGDPAQLARVLVNLCHNAHAAMPAGGDLLLDTGLVEVGPEEAAQSPHGRVGPFVCVRVRDTGVGMPPEVLRRIFEPFYTTKEDSGTGLGLSVVTEVVERHGGWISCRSSPGRGSCFTVYLPPASPLPAPAILALPAPAPRLSTRPAKVLLVESDPQVRRLAQLILQRGGHEVLLADSPAEGVSLLRRQARPPELLLLDQRHAFALVEMRAQAPRAGVVLACVSAPAELSEAARSHVVGLLRKPYDAEQLLMTVRGALARRERL